jgi:hypothetical protein
VAKPSVLYCDRKMLLEQHFRAAWSRPALNHGVQSQRDIDPALLTRRAVVVNPDRGPVAFSARGSWEIHNAAEVHVDEAHKNTSGALRWSLWNRHIDAGAVGFLWTATPLGWAIWRTT